MLLSEVEKCSFNPNGFPPHVKSPIIWGYIGNNMFPLCYLTKPKSLDKQVWDQFIAGINFDVKVTK
jgi:hypothetical protein